MYNTDISITGFKAIDSKVINELNREFFKKFFDLPSEFNWVKFSNDDTEEIARKKTLISDVKNQYLCGCCWAIASVTAISDAFVVSGLVNWKPQISYTYALSRYPQNQCAGGSSRVLLEDIKNGDGICSDYCVDESWCLNSNDCITPDSSLHLQSDSSHLNRLIPEVGCYEGNKLHYVYSIEDVYSMTVSEELKVFEAQTKMKQHILTRGPLVGGFLVLDNFPNGKFTLVNQGIYLEKCDYESTEKTFTYNVLANIIGSHAVVIVGWGLCKNVQYKNGITNIPYWFCRNSWGENWGENGYFKLAMYPYNKVCQFSKQVKVITPNKDIKLVGGVTGFKVNRPPVLRYLPSNNFKGQKHRSNVIYGIDENSIQDNVQKSIDYEFYGILTAFLLVIFLMTSK